MENNNQIQQELREICPSIMQISRNGLYLVPSAYFNNLAHEIMEKIKWGKEPFYYFSSITPFTVPAGYFESFAENFIKNLHLQQVKKEIFDEMEKISPFLNTISKKQLFKVPDNYFARDHKISVEKKLPEIKTLPIRKNRHYFMQYAAAAVITALIAIGFFLLKSKENTDLQSISKNSLVQVNTLSEKDIIDFLNSSPSAEEPTVTKPKSSDKESEVKSKVSKISDKELKDFLQENGESDEI